MNDDVTIPTALRVLPTDRLRQLMVDAATLAGSDVVGKVAADVYRRLACQCEVVINERMKGRAA